jgi:hypothetical protein
MRGCQVGIQVMIDESADFVHQLMSQVIDCHLTVSEGEIPYQSHGGRDLQDKRYHQDKAQWNLFKTFGAKREHSFQFSEADA